MFGRSRTAPENVWNLQGSCAQRMRRKLVHLTLNRCSGKTLHYSKSPIVGRIKQFDWQETPILHTHFWPCVPNVSEPKIDKMNCQHATPAWNPRNSFKHVHWVAFLPFTIHICISKYDNMCIYIYVCTGFLCTTIHLSRPHISPHIVLKTQNLTGWSGYLTFPIKASSSTRSCTWDLGAGIVAFTNLIHLGHPP